MPPKGRPKTAQRSASNQQAKLSFHGKQSKVTKPATTQQVKATKKDPALVEGVVRTELEPEKEESQASRLGTPVSQSHEEPTEDPLQSNGVSTITADVLGGRAQQSDAGAVGGTGSGWVGDEEAQARKISDAQVKKYWRAKEQERKAPRIHQEDLTVYEKVLREWDMSGQYGVSHHFVMLSVL